MNRRCFIAFAAAILYVAILIATWDVSTDRAKRQTESMLDYAILDLDSTLNGSIDTMLMHIGESIVKELEQAAPHSVEEMQSIAEQHDIDEINVVSKNGENLASTDDRLPGTNFNDKPKSKEFMVLTEGKRLGTCYVNVVKMTLKASK